MRVSYTTDNVKENITSSNETKDVQAIEGNNEEHAIIGTEEVPSPSPDKEDKELSEDNVRENIASSTEPKDSQAIDVDNKKHAIIGTEELPSP